MLRNRNWRGTDPTTAPFRAARHRSGELVPSLEICTEVVPEPKPKLNCTACGDVEDPLKPASFQIRSALSPQPQSRASSQQGNRCARLTQSSAHQDLRTLPHPVPL